MSNRKEITPEYVYVTIPSEYVCVYHRILAMLADYGEEMLKDCKASCTERNSGVIECFNMFNAAVAARHLGKEKLAETLIKYIKAKINQIYKGKDNSTGYVFPIDENGALKAFVSCNDRPRFWIDTDCLYKQDQNLGYEEEYTIEDENNQESYVYPFDFECRAEVVNNIIGVILSYYLDGEPLEKEEIPKVIVEYYVDGVYITDLSTLRVSEGTHKLMVCCYYKGGVMNHTYVVDNYES